MIGFKHFHWLKHPISPASCNYVLFILSMSIYINLYICIYVRMHGYEKNYLNKPNPYLLKIHQQLREYIMMRYSFLLHLEFHGLQQFQDEWDIRRIHLIGLITRKKERKKKRGAKRTSSKNNVPVSEKGAKLKKN